MNVTVTLTGPSQSGKTALAARIASDSEFPFVRVCTPENMIGFTESAKCHAIKQVGMSLTRLRCSFVMHIISKLLNECVGILITYYDFT